MSVSSAPEHAIVAEDFVEMAIAGVPHVLPKAVAEGILKRREEIAARRERFVASSNNKRGKPTRRRRRGSARSSRSSAWRSVDLRPARGRVRLFG